MNIDFFTLQKNIMDYIAGGYLPFAAEYGLDLLHKAVMSFPRLERERGSNKLAFFDFDTYTFERLTVESQLLKGVLNLYITLKGSAPAHIMSEEIAKYSTAFFLLIDKNPTLGGIVDYITVETIELYENAEGSENYKAALLRMRFEKEYT